MALQDHIAAPRPVSDSEEVDGYRGFIVQLNEEFRVANCSEDLQWILQRRRGRAHDGTTGWRSAAFCRTRAGLLSNIEERAGRIVPAVLAVVEALPERHP